MPYVVLLRTAVGSFLMLSGDKDIMAAETSAELVRYFEDGWAVAHRGGAASSTAATLSWMTLRPIIVEIRDVNQLNDEILQRNERGRFTSYGLSSVATRGVSGFPVRPDAVDDLIRNGVEPRLIHDAMLA